MKTMLFVLLLWVLALAAPAMAEGDAVRGERSFAKCSVCHDVDHPRTRMGPHLMGVVGRPAGIVVDFASYSDAMKAAQANGVVWNENELSQFLASPRKFLPGTSMRFFGLWSQSEIDDIIAYLKTIPATQK
ncbi:cytochrome c family protein [Agrobacterium larrymoorei]|nr:cytochrome c family protein [Agrobacterium larrymoorei]